MGRGVCGYAGEGRAGLMRGGGRGTSNQWNRALDGGAGWGNSCHADEEADVLLAAATDDAAEDGVARVEDQERDLSGSRISIIGLDTIQVSDSEGTGYLVYTAVDGQGRPGWEGPPESPRSRPRPA